MQHVVWPIFVAALMPFVLTGIAKVGAFTLRDNHQTRTWQAQLTGYRARAHAAHLNSFEAFPIFAAAAILAGARVPLHTELPLLCWGFVGARVGYAYCYIADHARARSVVWFIGLGCCAALFFLAAKL
jgi:uncharacterized MAPEG superfamily protein